MAGMAGMAGMGRTVGALGRRALSGSARSPALRGSSSVVGRSTGVLRAGTPLRWLASEGQRGGGSGSGGSGGGSGGGGVFSNLHDELNDQKEASSADQREPETSEGSGSQQEAAGSEAHDKGSGPEDAASAKAGKDFDSAVGMASSFWTDLKDAAADLFTIDRDRSVLTKRVHEKYSPPPKAGEEGTSEAEEQAAYDGPSEIMVVDPGKSTWERLGDRLREAPLYQELLRRAKEAQKSEFGQKATEATDRVKDRIENMQEAWETSQNPWVYRISEVWDSLTHETDTARVIKELWKMDPDFSLEVWKDDVSQHFVPRLLEAWIRGDKKFLKHWCQDDTYKKLSNDIKQREQEQVVVDPNILSVDFAEVIVDPSLTERNALLGLFVAVQQISCVRDRSGEIKEGAEDNIKLNKYFLVFQREYIMEDGELQWKVADFGFQGEEYMAI